MILKSLLIQIINSQNEHAESQEKGMIRDSLNKIKTINNYAHIISGIRRCGKSTLLHQYLNKNYPNAFFINFDDPRLAEFESNDWFRLDEIIKEETCKVLFFDEIQVITGWEKYVRQKLDESYQIYITGSNASLLSRELGSKLTGRHIGYELFPFSYSEFLKFKKINPSLESLQLFMKIGGFPEYLKTEDSEILLQLFNDILIRDISVRYGIRDYKLLQRLALFLISNIGNRITGTSLKKQFGFGSTATVLEYLSHLETSYLFFFISKFSYSIKVQSINPKKVYSIDNGLIQTNSISFNENIGNIFENLIFLHLKQKKSEIYYFSEKGECDFVVFQNGKITKLIQACIELNNDNLERETNGLFEAMDFFNIKKGTIVTLKQSDKIISKDKTINIVEAYKFLLDV